MKNYGDLGGCYPPRPHTLLDLHNSSYDTKAKFSNCFIIHSKLTDFLTGAIMERRTAARSKAVASPPGCIHASGDN